MTPKVNHANKAGAELSPKEIADIEKALGEKSPHDLLKLPGFIAPGPARSAP